MLTAYKMLRWLFLSQPASRFITDLYVTLPESIIAIPQMYTIHCVHRSRAPGLKVQYRMEATGKYCVELPGLLCRLNDPVQGTLTKSDTRLEVTWAASVVVTLGTYLPQPEQRVNGDHDFVCNTMLENTSSLDSQVISSPITIRGILVRV